MVPPIKINKLLYVPKAPLCLMSQQQWEHQEKGNYPKSDGTWCATKARQCTLYWKQEQYRHIIPSYPSINLARIRLVPLSNNYRVFVSSYKEEHTREDIEHFCY